MDRTDDILIPPGTAWLNDKRTKAVCDAITAEGADIFFVGGCVRDALLGVEGADTDLATPVRPQEVERLAALAGLKSVPTGIDHGTVTVISGGKPFEITTFRKDVATDGRRAVVAFADDIADDARRRDFTFNALYATPQGRIVDPLGGLDDCLARHVRFIEDPDRRIREDYLRILRFFRFHAWYARPGEGFDADALAAISRNTDGLETLSAERVGSEMLRLLAAPDPAPALAAMHHCGALARILPGADPKFTGPVAHIEGLLGVRPDAVRRLAALGGERVAEALRLSRKNARQLETLRGALADALPLTELAWRQGSETATDVLILQHAISGTPPGKDAIKQLEHASKAVFPVTAQDLMPAWRGPDLGARLRALEAKWIASGFQLSRDELLSGD